MEEIEKKPGKLQWFFFVIFIPLLFAIALSLVILTIAGINIFEFADDYKSKIPFLTDQTEETTKQQEPKESVYELKATIEEQKTRIATTETEVESKQQEIDKLQAKIEELQEELSKKVADEKKAEDIIEDIAKMYADMSAKNAASILSVMDNGEAIEILKRLKNETRAPIIEKMDPEKAAEITSLLTN